MAFIRQIDEEEAEGPLRQVYEAARRRAGHVANIIRVMSRDAASAQASMQFYTGVMKSPGPLATARREMIAAVVSSVNACYY